MNVQAQVMQTAACTINNEKQTLNDLSQEIWNYKELRFLEVKSHAFLCQFLEDHGFSVQRRCGPLETAFIATWETKHEDGTTVSKPHIGVLCEYDALPEIGHACGHNLIAEIGVAAALGIKASMEEHGIKGKLSVLGTPAEEGGGGKLDMLKEGVFKDLDVALMAHPAPFSDSRPIFLGTNRFKVNFEGKPSHAAGFPWEGVNALDAAVQAYTSISCLRQQMKPDWRVSVNITKGGTAVNIIPRESQLVCQVRTAKNSDIAELEKKVKKCVTAAADATGCTVSMVDFPKPYKNLVSNETLARLYESSLTSLGVTVTTPKTKIILGSTDMGDVSHAVPSLHPVYNCHTTAFNHTPEFTTAAGSPDAQPPTLDQAKALAMTALQVFYDPSLLDSIRQDFKEDMMEQA